MSVLIEGMEMPQNCDECPLNSTCGYSLHMPLYHIEKRHDDCPLIEVPEPHGRLIAEADAIETAWMILQGLGYRIGENQQLEESVREVFATAPAIEVE